MPSAPAGPSCRAWRREGTLPSSSAVHCPAPCRRV
jgi:hypothetical protein